MRNYQSTSCLKGDVFDILNRYERAGRRYVELGSTHPYNEKISPETILEYGFNYLVHNYFPPPKEPFIINIASHDQAILKRSMDQLKTSIDFCNSIDTRLFTFHSGFRADPDLNFQFKTDQIISHHAAMKTFTKSLFELNKYAADRGVKIAIENNVLAPHNLVNGKNELLLMCEPWEFEHLINEIDSDNLGILLDLGHLKVTSNTLRYDADNFIQVFKDQVFAVHLHENNGKLDQHLHSKKDDWSCEVVNNYFNSVPVVNEALD